MANINPGDADSVWIDRGVYEEVEERHQMLQARQPNMNGDIPPNRPANCNNPDNTKNNPSKKNKQSPKTPNVCPLKIKSNNDNTNPQTPTTPTQTPNEDVSLPTSTKENKAKDGNVKNKVEKKKRDKKNNKEKMGALTALPPSSTSSAASIISNPGSSDLNGRVSNLEKENQELKAALQKVQDKLAALEDLQKSVKQLKIQLESLTKSKSVPETAPTSGSADDNVDLFGSDSEDDEEASKIRDQRLKAYQDKKSKKPALIAKSSIIFDVKPWDDETDMAKLEEAVRSIQMDGLLWGASKLVPLAYGIHKLQINSVIEDEKISVDQLQETIEAFEDYVQSVDIFAFNKI